MGPALTAKLRELRRDWRAGRHYGYPLCCVAMYLWDRLWSLPPSLTRTCSQRVQSADSTLGHVSCGVVHGDGSPDPWHRRVPRIARFWMPILTPAAPTWRRRPTDRLIPRPPWVPMAPQVEFPWGEARPLDDALAEVDGIGVDPDLVWR